MNWWFPGSRASVQTHQRRRSWSRAENKDNRPLILMSMFGFGLKQQPLQRPLLVQLSWTCTLSYWSKRLTFNGSAWDVVGVRFTCDLRCLGCCFLFPGVICIQSVSLVKPCEPAPCVLVVDTGPVQSQSSADTGAEQQRSRRMFGLFLLLMALIKLQQRKVKRIEPRPWNTIETEKCKSSHHQMILHVEGHRFLRLQILLEDVFPLLATSPSPAQLQRVVSEGDPLRYVRSKVDSFWRWNLFFCCRKNRRQMHEDFGGVKWKHSLCQLTEPNVKFQTILFFFSPDDIKGQRESGRSKSNRNSKTRWSPGEDLNMWLHGSRSVCSSSPDGNDRGQTNEQTSSPYHGCSSWYQWNQMKQGSRHSSKTDSSQNRIRRRWSVMLTSRSKGRKEKTWRVSQWKLHKNLF